MHQVEHALRLGYLKPGDQLPKVRDVVAALVINPNTVLKAYKELETKGLTAGRPGQGTFIQATLSQVALPELTALRRSLSGWLTAAEGAGLAPPGWTRTAGSWSFVLLHWFRRLRVRWEIRDGIHEAFLSLAGGIICWRRLASMPLCEEF